MRGPSPGQKGTAAWPLLIIAIIVIFGAGMAVTLYLAGRGGVQLVDADYYEQGKNYDRSGRRENSAGRQTLKMAVARREQDLLVTVTDIRSQGIARADVRYFATEGDHGRGVLLKEEGRGGYLLPLADINPSGRGRIVVTVGDAVLTENIRVIGP